MAFSGAESASGSSSSSPGAHQVAINEVLLIVKRLTISAKEEVLLKDRLLCKQM